MSYQVIIHRPGMSMRIESFHRPPWYQDGSLGVRRIMPGLPEGVVSAKMPCWLPTAARISFSGRCWRAFDQSTVGGCAARSYDLAAVAKASCDMPGGKLGLPSLV